MIYSQHCELQDMAFLDLKVRYSKVTTQHFFTFPLSDICFAYFFLSLSSPIRAVSMNNL